MLDRIVTAFGRIGYRIASALITADRSIRASHGRGVKLVVESPEGEILLVRHTYGKRHWTLPGGGVRPDESHLDAGNRELYEEFATIAGESIDLGAYPVRHHRRLEVVGVVLARNLACSITPRAIEIAEVRWCRRRDVPRDIDPGAITALGLLDGRCAELAAAGPGS